MAKTFYEVAGKPSCGTANVTIYTAAVIANEFRHTPTVAQLRERFEMSRATAYRWVGAFKAARGEP